MLNLDRHSTRNNFNLTVDGPASEALLLRSVHHLAYHPRYAILATRPASGYPTSTGDHRDFLIQDTDGRGCTQTME
jgi:hypothetical protein